MAVQCGYRGESVNHASVIGLNASKALDASIPLSVAPSVNFQLLADLAAEAIERQARHQGLGCPNIGVREVRALQMHIDPFIVHEGYRRWMPRPEESFIFDD